MLFGSEKKKKRLIELNELKIKIENKKFQPITKLGSFG